GGQFAGAGRRIIDGAGERGRADERGQDGRADEQAWHDDPLCCPLVVAGGAKVQSRRRELATQSTISSLRYRARAVRLGVCPAEAVFLSGFNEQGLPGSA